MKNLLFSGLSCAAILFIAASSASAEAIIPTNPTSPVVTNSVATTGYYLFDTYPDVNGHPAAADINQLPGYASLTEEGPLFGPEGLSPDLTVNGTTYKGDGVDFANAGAATDAPVTGTPIPGTGTPVEFATFALGAGTPAAFEVGLLSNYPDATYFGLSLYNGDPNNGPAPLLLASMIIDPDQTRNEVSSQSSNLANNEFYYADVTGAASGDYLVVDGYSSVDHTSQVTLGGVTFDSVPEPCTSGLLLAGLGAMGVLKRRRVSL